MSLSFEDSLKNAQEQNSDTSVGDWVKPSNASLYIYYDNEYFDDDFSTIDRNKNIVLNSNQTNLTQEKNSQYIPFEIQRYYDGFDLSNTKISIYWVNKSGYGNEATPVDVYFNSDKIRFAWLVDNDVTSLAGKINFEIHASGTNSHGFDYLWKTKPNDGINILQSLMIKKFIEPDDAWQENFIENISAQVKAAEEAKEEAVAAAEESKRALEELQNGINEEVQMAMGDNYYTKEQVDEAIANAVNKNFASSINEILFTDMSDGTIHRLYVNNGKLSMVIAE